MDLLIGSDAKPYDRQDHSDLEDETFAGILSNDALREIARSKENKEVKTKMVTTTAKTRDAYIAEYAKRRANGFCQLCGNEAPFLDKHGRPYLESHHIVWMANGGADSIDNTVALCPNCHRKMHQLNDDKDVAALIEKNRNSDF